MLDGGLSAPIGLPLSLLVMAFRAIVSDDGGDVGRRGIGPHWVAPFGLPLSLVMRAFKPLSRGGGDVLRRACGSEDCLVWAGLVPSLLVATSDSCHEFAQADLLSEVALEPVHKPFN